VLRIATEVPADPDLHMFVLDTMLDLQATAKPSRLGTAGQQARRDIERLVRRRAVAITDQLIERGDSLVEAAQRLGLCPRTLRYWRRTCRTPTPAPALGRPLAVCDATQQQAVHSWLDEIGPGVGMPTLRAHFNDLARAELDAQLHAYRRVWREANRRTLHMLEWTRPGVVWAMDFAHAPHLIEGVYPYLLAVRDLASGQQLLWQPVHACTAEVVLAELPLLFALHGAPWVLKMDNGSAFIADLVRWYLHRAGVHPLYSPPYTPEYNGAIEASIGSLKTRTERHCLQAGHPGVCTSADTEAARTEANTTARPRRLHGSTPQQTWDARTPLTADERAHFDATLAPYRAEERTHRGWSADLSLTRAQQAALDRVALRRALVALDLLLFRRRRILPRITRPKAASEG
jgi:transposase-like protein